MLTNNITEKLGLIRPIFPLLQIQIKDLLRLSSPGLGFSVEHQLRVCDCYTTNATRGFPEDGVQESQQESRWLRDWDHRNGRHGKDVRPEAQRCRMEVMTSTEALSLSQLFHGKIVYPLTSSAVHDDLSAFGSSIVFDCLTAILAPDPVVDFH